ncbi:uncharacterized protein [Clytia hemisphaerica]|uniref:uncharacterized protein isoform X2 n=1 Tax=Clytia hemisphaerica TaxID=252671 RepID=UPI0034D535A5
MSVENQILTLAELTSLVKQNLKRCFVFCLISVSLMLLGGLLFFYIEHCATTTKTIISKQQQGEVNCIKLCDQLIKYRNETHEIPSLVNLTATCSVECKVPVWRRECELNRAYFFMWTEYAMTVATTIVYTEMRILTDSRYIETIYSVFIMTSTIGFGDFEYDTMKLQYDGNLEKVVFATSDLFFKFINLALVGSFFSTFSEFQLNMSSRKRCEKGAYNIRKTQK